MLQPSLGTHRYVSSCCPLFEQPPLIPENVDYLGCTTENCQRSASVVTIAHFCNAFGSLTETVTVCGPGLYLLCFALHVCMCVCVFWVQIPCSSY